MCLTNVFVTRKLCRLKGKAQQLHMFLSKQLLHDACLCTAVYLDKDNDLREENTRYPS